MRDLGELQNRFQEYILQQNPSIEDVIISTSNVPASARLEIYREAYYARLLESLSHDYPVLNHLMGDDEFNQLGRQYIETCPSGFRSIRWFGKELATFIEDTSHHSKMPWLVEMAQFEWLLTEAFDADDSTIVSITEMATIPFNDWPNLQFKIHPSLRQLTLNWNIAQLWETANDRGECLSPQKMDKAENWIIWRKGYDIQFCHLSSEEYYMLEGMISGKNFGEICEGLSQWINEQDIALEAAKLLKRFIMDGMIVEIQIG